MLSALDHRLDLLPQLLELLIFLGACAEKYEELKELREQVKTVIKRAEQEEKRRSSDVAIMMLKHKNQL